MNQPPYWWYTHGRHECVTTVNDNRFPTRTPLDSVTVPTTIGATSQLRSCSDHGGLTVISVTSRLMAHDNGTVIMRKVCYQVYICTILGASFQPKNCVLLSWVSLSCYEARRRESHSSPFPLQHLHESYDQPVG